MSKIPDKQVDNVRDWDPDNEDTTYLPNGNAVNRTRGEYYIDPDSGVNVGPDWHTEKLCQLLGNFDDGETNHLKALINQAFQGSLGGNPSNCTPVQFEGQRTPVRQGDPSGFLGQVFKCARQFYYLLEFVPILNWLPLWAAFDIIVLRRSEEEVAQRYCNALRAHFFSFKQNQLA